MTEITPKAIVVVKGIHEDGGTLGARADQGPWHWYARVKVRGKESDDSKILRSIPRTLVLRSSTLPLQRAATCARASS